MASFTISLLVQHGSMTRIETVVMPEAYSEKGAHSRRGSTDNNQHTCMSSVGNVEHQTSRVGISIEILLVVARTISAFRECTWKLGFMHHPATLT